MKWKTKHSRMYNIYYGYFFGKRRGFIKKQFLFLPIEINGEIRWLETVKIKWRINCERGFWTDEIYYEWYPYEFINN